MVSQSEILERAQSFFYFEYDFVLQALGASVLVGAVCAVVGTFLVLRGMSLLGDATGHATLPGVAGAFLLTGYQHYGALLLGALVSGGLGALAVGLLSRGRRVRPDAAIGIVLAVFFGAGIMLMAYIQDQPTGRQAGLDQFLFGNAESITAEQLAILAAIGGGLILAVLIFYRPLALMIFDEGFARSVGIKTARLEVGLLVALSLAVVISIQAVGVVLVAAMLIIPPSAGRFLAAGLGGVIAWAVAIGVVSGALGAFISYVFVGVATGPAMVLAAASFFMLALVFGPRQGLLVGRRKRRREP